MKLRRYGSDIPPHIMYAHWQEYLEFYPNEWHWLAEVETEREALAIKWSMKKRKCLITSRKTYVGTRLVFGAAWRFDDESE